MNDGARGILSVVETPETFFASSGDLRIAYQVFGSGPIDIVHVSNWTWVVDLSWDHPLLPGWLGSFGEFGRVCLFDMPGTGSSDPLPGDRSITLEEWMDTVGVVMDTAGMERAALVAQDIGGMMAMLFAAAHPERVTSLVLVGSTARLNEAPDYPAGYPEQMRERGLEWWLDVWGTGRQLALTAPSIAHDADLVALDARWERLAVPPATARKVFRLVADLDVRNVLEAIRVPTLVIHRRGDRWIPVAQGRYLADHIDGARYVELPGDDHMPFVGDPSALVAEIRDFLGATRAEAKTEADRVLATVLFTDIVGSTERAAALGDRQWKQLLDAHDRVTRTAIERHRGREIVTTGDGFLATFDGPGKAIGAASEIRKEALRLGIELRAGLHAGEVELRGEDIGGLAVHIASRVMAHASAGEIMVSSTVKDLVIGAGFAFEDRGPHELKGVPGEWHLFAVAG